MIFVVANYLDGAVRLLMQGGCFELAQRSFHVAYFGG
jgi:hypothetical protein